MSTGTAQMWWVLAADDDFNVDWPDGEDAAKTWTLDAEHSPGALPPFQQELSVRSTATAMSTPMILVNSYLFMDMSQIRMPAPPREHRAMDVHDYWETTAGPTAEAHVRAILDAPVEGEDAEAIARMVPELVEHATSAFVETMRPVLGLMMATMPLLEFCRERLGEREGTVRMHAMLQGRESETTKMARVLERIAEGVAAVPGLAEAVGAPAEGRAALAAHQPLAEEFDAFLDRYGWRARTWSEVHMPTWAEDPRVPLAMVARYAADESTRPSVAQARSAERASEAVAELKGRLKNDDERAELDELLARCARYVAVREGRAHWQLRAPGALRKPLLALGRALVSEGRLEDPEGVFFLYLEEFETLGKVPGDELRGVVQERRAEFERHAGLTPPPYLGTPPSQDVRMPGDIPAPEERLSADGRVVRGSPASGGVVHARARVIENLDDSHRLEPGEVLVCGSTAPPWTPLFGIASAVVTDGGGLTSHSAIAAREYGIPCVVSTRVATGAIPDGAMVTVDGDLGTVTIDS